MLLCGSGCCLWTHGLSGRQARLWGRAAPWAAHVPRSQALRPSSTLRTGGAFAADVGQHIALMPSYGCQPVISHVIPQ